MEKIVGNIDSWWSVFMGELRSHKDSRWKKGKKLGVDICFLWGIMAKLRWEIWSFFK